MTARIYTDQQLVPGIRISLPPVAARHVQVLRFQPGQAVMLFNGLGPEEGEFTATIDSMGRSDVQVTVGAFSPTQREAPRTVHLAVGMPANERMDWLVEKATELGVASIQPLMTERSVLRLSGERADKKRAHWQGIAVAACEQCGRNRVPLIHAPATLSDWLKTRGQTESTRLLLSLQDGSQPLVSAVVNAVVNAVGTASALTFLSGPEGGLSATEEALAAAKGFAAVTLGPRVLRAETAPLACLALVALTGPT
ncbi:MAG: 16S rRNA (uracil(1498)-N(3))-methyltransferase [Polaromonas sp.]